MKTLHINYCRIVITPVSIFFFLNATFREQNIQMTKHSDHFQLPLCPQDAVQRVGLRASRFCPVTMANAVNGTTTPTSQLQFAPSFRSVPKGSLGPRSRPTGQIIGRRGRGAEERANRGRKKRRLQEWIPQPALSPLHPPPPTPIFTCLLGKL